MTDAAKKSFEIRTARDFLDELLRPAHADFMKDPLSSRKAIGCAIFAWHLRDWVWAQYKTELHTELGLRKRADLDHLLFAACPEFEIIQELANGSKHFKGEGSAVAGTELAHGYASGLLLVFTQSHLIVKTGTTSQFAENLLTKVLSHWDDFFAQYLAPHA